MRLYHPKTLKIFAYRNDIPKRYSTSCWSEIFKWKASKQDHPKMFIYNDYYLGGYLRVVFEYAKIKKCNFAEFNRCKEKVSKLGEDILNGFLLQKTKSTNIFGTKSTNIFGYDPFAIGIDSIVISEQSSLNNIPYADCNNFQYLISCIKRGGNLKIFENFFNDDYLLSDACSLYYKGINIFPDIYGDQWRKYIPVENHKEILRQVLKTITGKNYNQKQINNILNSI